MNIANVTKRFVLLSGIDKSEAVKWRTLIDDSCAYIENRLLVENPDRAQQRRIEALCAAYAYKTYCMCNDTDISAFTAGEVHISSPARQDGKAQKLWKSLLNESVDLIRGDEFLFGRVI
ncbi:MAG TPA: hypothetical protein DEO32_02155 [Ruminococcaceae bacterium]|nr:hypothetical protein [Oscillospiraceae bacterium]